jgi:hypothetical protein
MADIIEIMKNKIINTYDSSRIVSSCDALGIMIDPDVQDVQ